MGSFHVLSLCLLLIMPVLPHACRSLLPFPLHARSRHPHALLRLSSSSSSSSSPPPEATAASILSLLGGAHHAASVDPSLARQLRSCLRFLVPLDYQPLPAAPHKLPSRLSRRSIDDLIRWPPSAVSELARESVEGGGDESVVWNSLSADRYLVPDVEGAAEEHCQLTKYTYGHRFNRKELNQYMAFLFEAIAALTPYLGFNVTLNRFDLFHGHMFLAGNTGRLGILFHAREYPAFSKEDFPVHLGYCQVGSPLEYDESVNLRNILWLAPLPDCSDHSGTPKWLAPGSLVVLDAHPEGIIYKDLVPDYVDIVRTIYEDDFGDVVADVNYFSSINDKPEERIFIC